MADDLVARLRYEQELCAVMGDTKAGTLVGEAADRLDAAEARVRELEAQLADQRAMSKYNREQAEKAALSEAYERAAKVADDAAAICTSRSDAAVRGSVDMYRHNTAYHAASSIAAAIRNLAQEVK